MKATTVIALAAGFTASLVSAQGLDSIPPCALQCALKSLSQSTSCSPSDIGCICSAKDFVKGLVPCVQGACTSTEFQDTIVAAKALCQAAGVTLSVPTAVATAAPTTSAASSVAATATSEVSSIVSSTILTSVVSNATTTATSTKPTGSGTGTQSPTPSGTGSGADRNAVALTGLGAIVALVAALL